MWETEVPEGAEALGYKKLIEIFNIQTIPHFRWSYSSIKWETRILHFKNPDLTLHLYPISYRLSNSVFEHLEFALKNEGLNLYILKKVLLQINPSEITAYLKSKPTGKYARMLWFLYEAFQESQLMIPDLNRGTYVNLLDPKQYYTGKPVKSARHRIVVNLLGSLSFAPMVRNTTLLKQFAAKQIERKVEDLAKQYDPALLARAMMYLYTKETMSSWEIEREKPDHAKLAKFVGLLHRSDSIGNLNEETFVRLQKNIVDPRFALNSYRDFQNYVGEEPSMNHLIVHYIAPRPENVRDLMKGLIDSFEVMEKSGTNPVIAAAVLSFLFVFIHPFEDGNGRIHRFLIHYVLARLKFTPKGIVFPVSAAIVRNMHLYDTALETFSKPLNELIVNYRLDDSGCMTVLQETHDFYRYIDLTSIAEYLYECVDRTMIKDFQEELAFLADYDRIKQQCKDIVDMPDQKVDLLIKCIRQNGGTLSSRKQESHFSMLTNDEIKKIEGIISNKILDDLTKSGSSNL